MAVGGLAGLAGGQSLGTAFGRIRIDTSDLNQVKTTISSVATEAERGFKRIGSSAAVAQRSFSGIGASIQSIAGPFGIVFGAAGAAQLARFALASDEIATSYRRQSVAAVNLAGSQSTLNSLLVAYDRATGGAIDKATALADVTRLQAIGFADNANELERFVRASRGAALATGRTQEYIISQVQLSIANQSTMRLDQIGLGVTEVKTRIDELRASNSALTTEMAYQEAVLGLLEEKYGALADSAEAQATGAEKAARAWKDLRLEIGLLAESPVGETMGELAESIGGVNTLLELGADQAERLNQQLGGLADHEAILRILGFVVNPAQGSVRGLGDVLGLINAGGEGREAGRSRLGARTSIGRVAATEGFSRAGIGGALDTTERDAAIQEWADSVKQIEADSAQQRLAATEQYEKQRSETIASYERSIAREAEDFARQRARQEEQLAKQIADIRMASVQREREWQAEYTETVAEIRADANERIADIEEDYARSREQRERSHRDNLLNAAARLDAHAVAQEQRRYARETRDAEEAHNDRISDERESLQERLDSEQKAHQERLQQAREADDERIADMQEAQAEQQRLADEDRAIRLARQAEDHQAQLAAQDTQHQARLTQIAQQAQDERTQLDTEFQKQLEKEGTATEAFIAAQESRRDAALETFNAWWDEINKTIGARMPGTYYEEYQSGGFVPRTGLAKLHAGEYVLSPQVTRALNDMTGGLSQRGLVAMAGNRSMSLNMHPGAIQVYAAAGQDAGEVAYLVRQEIAGLLQEVAHQ